MTRPEVMTGWAYSPECRGRRGGWLTPVVSHLDRPAVSKFANRDVAVETPVAVIARPLDDHHIVSLDSLTDRQHELGEVALHGSDEVGPTTTSSICGHCRSTSSASGTPSM
jgi:hypothetical protein